tara:strand:- start:71 stop:289 length:219 start_codon:yes stop_codon:yes gene_type:complete
VKIGTLVRISESGMMYSGLPDTGARENIGIIVGKTFLDGEDVDWGINEKVDLYIVLVTGERGHFYKEDLLKI